jgi:hypothetical protein
MSVSKALYGSVEDSIIALVLRRGCPIVEEGKENPALIEHGYAASAWKDTHTQSHINGGSSYDEGSRQWIPYEGCHWDYRDAVLTRDDVDEKTGKIVFEVEGLLCNCGQYSSQRVRYMVPKENVMKEITAELTKRINFL